MIKATPMTEKSWILFEDTERCGLMRLSKDGEYIVTGGPYKGKYADVDKLNEATKVKVKFEKLKENKEQEKTEIGEYPVKHDTAFEVEPKDGLHLYTKIEGSKDVYAAGYFSIKGKEKWQTVFCPRHKVLNDAEYHGPYKSKIDADHETRIENNKT